MMTLRNAILFLKILFNKHVFSTGAKQFVFSFAPLKQILKRENKL